MTAQTIILQAADPEPGKRPVQETPERLSHQRGMCTFILHQHVLFEEIRQRKCKTLCQPHVTPAELDLICPERSVSASRYSRPGN